MGGRYVPPHMRNRPAGDAAPSAPPPVISRGPDNGFGNSSSSARLPPRNGAGGGYTQAGLSGRQGWGDRDGGRGGVGGRSAGRALYVFGDSFVGPFKLLADTASKTQTFKGASAKGLSNPNSIKQVSKELVPLLNQLLAPPPYAYLPPTGRYALLIFGNVDLQVNYLWQLQNKPLGPGTFTRNAVAEADAPAAPEAEDILATATENSGKGPALGPELFVETVLKAYTSWLEREVVNGPIGRRAEAVAAAEKEDGARKLAPTKVLVSSALPPLVEDPILARIPEKYVERLEEDHARAHREMRGGGVSRTPWSPKNQTSEIEASLAAASLDDKPGAAVLNGGAASKTSVAELLAHDPPLCTKPIRIEMTRKFNQGLRAFCDQHPLCLAYVDISGAMLALDAAEQQASNTPPPDTPDEVSRETWACPVDPTNIHPLWEPTLPLWLKALAELGVPTDKLEISKDAEETFKAYEVDKRRRVKDKEFPVPAEDLKTGERIKLRDE